jgi:PAS domain-containing protein
MSAIAALARDQDLLHRALGRLPAGAYTCDGDGLITWFNDHALHVWGRAPALNDPRDRYCGSFRLFTAHDEPIAHDECWMALAIRNRHEYLAQEIVVERPDRSRITALAYATPVLDDNGEVVSAINILVNISDRKRIEDLLRRANRDNDLYRATLADALRDEMQPMHAELALLTAACAGQPGIAAHAATLQAQLQRLSALVDDLVDIAAH